MIRAIVSTWLCFLFWSPPVAAEERVDVALVLAADISYSIGPYELDLQRRGYIRAFRSTDVIKTITSGRRGRIAVSYLEWAGENSQTLVLPWTLAIAAKRLKSPSLQANPWARMLFCNPVPITR